MGELEAADAGRCRAALVEVVPRLTSLVRGIRRPDAPAVGVWSVADVAVHCAHVWEALPALAAGGTESPIANLDDLAPLTQSMVAADADRDPASLATRIERGAETFLELLDRAEPDAQQCWLIAGITASPSTFACHVLNESLVHGHDIAHAEGVPWPIADEHAALALLGFLFPMLARIDPAAVLDSNQAKGLHATWDIRLRGEGRAVIAIDDGRVRVLDRPDGKVDCRITVDAAPFFLLTWNRAGQWRSVLRGRLIAWGRRPWMAGRLRTVVRNP